MTLNELKELHALIIQFEDAKLLPTKYFEEVNKITGLKLNGCNTCGAYNNKQHNDVQIYFWQKVSEHAPSYLPKTPLFKLPRLNSPYYQEQIAKWSFTLMKNNIESLKAERDRNFISKKDKDLYDAYQADIDTLNELLKAKRAFVEYEEYIENEDLVRLKEAGWTTALIAERLKVNPETVRKRIKALDVKHVEDDNKKNMLKSEEIQDDKPSKKTRKKKEVNNGEQETN